MASSGPPAPLAARQPLSRDGPRGVQHLYFEVIRRVMDACKEDFRNDGIDVGEGSALVSSQAVCLFACDF